MSLTPWKVGLIAACAVAVGWRASVLAVESGRARGVREQLGEVTTAAQEVLDLRAKRPTAGMGARPTEDVSTLLAAVMKEVGLPENRLRAVSPEGESKLPADPLWPGVERRRQGVRVAIEPMLLPELGAFLQRWQASQSVWSVAAIELSKTGNGAAGTDPPYRVFLSLTATYVDGPRK